MPAASFPQSPADTSDELQKKAPRLFIDCSSCDQDYLRTEITFVNYVRDPGQADIHFLLTDQRTGSGGTEYTLTLIGRLQFTGMNDTLTYIANRSDTDAMIRSGILRVLKSGLLRYMLHTPLGSHFSVAYSQPTRQAAVTDAWDYWVFKVSLSSFINGEQQTSNGSFYGSLSANRVTPEWKLNFSMNADYRENRYDVDPVTTLRTYQRGRYFNALAVKSIDDHWSAGLSGSIESSTYGNTDLLWRIAPALEYDLFPYSESTRQQLRFTYYLGYNRARYSEETIFDRTQEGYVNQTLAIALELKQPWGSVSTTLRGTHYPWDFRNEGKPAGEQISWNLFGMISWRIIEGLSFNLFGSYSSIHDQFSLIKAGASRDDILLQQTRLATNYSYFVSFGLSYSFGAIFNNVVNPRLGNEGGSSFSISF
jgi:hypothetical protein